MKMIDKFIPTYCYKDIYEIDYTKLYSSGIKIILFDLDNTIQKNIDKTPSLEAINKINEIKKMGFKVYILSNNSMERIQDTLTKLDVSGFARAQKPLKKGFKKVLNNLYENKLINDNKEVLMIGDQVLTDVWGANKMGLHSLLVKPIDLSTEKWYTTLNRNTERIIIEKIKKRDIEKYKQIKKMLGD